MFNFNFSVAFSSVSLLVIFVKTCAALKEDLEATCPSLNKDIEVLKKAKLVQIATNDEEVPKVLGSFMVADTIALSGGEDKEMYGFAVSNLAMKTFLQAQSIAELDDYSLYFSYSEDEGGEKLDSKYQEQFLNPLKNCILLTPTTNVGKSKKLYVGIFQKDRRHAKDELPEKVSVGRVIQAWVNGKEVTMVIVVLRDFTIEDMSSREVWTLDELTYRRQELLNIFTKEQDIIGNPPDDIRKTQALQATEFYLLEPTALKYVEVASSD